MNDKLINKDWNSYIKKEISRVKPILLSLGFTLDKNQVHIGGERYLMSGKKLVLNGERALDKKRVVIKVSRNKESIKEIEKEHKTKKDLNKLEFAYHRFFSPKEILYTKSKGFLISISEYIKENKAFLSHSLEEQFFLSLRAFDIQEGAHATAYSHFKKISKSFGSFNENDYLKSLTRYIDEIKNKNPDNNSLKETLTKAYIFFSDNLNIIKEYGGFLTHSDFVIHNLRIVEKDIYLLDHTSLHFGNKYESWARFLNFMVIYNKPLEEALNRYIKNNRNEDELLCLRLMRVYKIVFLLKYHSEALKNSEGDLLKLCKIRIDFWASLMDSLISNTEIKKDTINKYIISRDNLRSEEEKNRQKELNQI